MCYDAAGTMRSCFRVGSNSCALYTVGAAGDEVNLLLIDNGVLAKRGKGVIVRQDFAGCRDVMQTDIATQVPIQQSISLQPQSIHPHSQTDANLISLFNFGTDKPLPMINFH